MSIYKKDLLQKIIITSFFISMIIISDLIQNSYLTFLKFTGIKFFKISFIIISLSGFFLNFQYVLIICLFYFFFHLMSNINSITLMMNILKLDFLNIKFLGLLFFDYFLPDLIMCLSFLFYLSDSNFQEKNSRTKIFLIMLIINIWIFLSRFFSSYFIYYPEMFEKNKIILKQSMKIYDNFLFSCSEEKQKLVFCFIYNFFPSLFNWLVSSFFICLFNIKFQVNSIKYTKK